MVIGYLRVSTNKQEVENQRFEVLQLANNHKLSVDSWVEESVSGSKSFKKRQLGELIKHLEPGDTILASEITRLSRSLMDLMQLLSVVMEKQACLLTFKEKFELNDSLNSKVLAYAFGLASEVERILISSRVRESLQRLKHEGRVLGRPKGSKGTSKLSDREDLVRELIVDRMMTKASVCRLLEVHPQTLDNFMADKGIEVPDRSNN